MKAVLTDIGGVVMPFSSPDEVIDAWERRLELEQGALGALMWDREQMDHATLGRITAEEYWEFAAARLRISGAMMEELVKDFFQSARPEPGLLAFIQSLRPMVKTCAITNGWSDLPRVLKDKAVDSAFDVILVSAIEGLAKPDVAIFELALKRLGVKPSQAIFIDDTQGHVEAATSLGIVGHWHRSIDTTIKTIREFLAS